MEASPVVRERPRRTPKPRNRFAYDGALIKAKTEKKEVDLALTLDLPTPDGKLLSADETIAAGVCHVDTYSVLFEIKERKIWISKAHIVGVWLR